MNWGSEKIAVMVIRPCVVEPFHFGLAPTPARQDSGSISSSSPVVHNLVLKKVFLNFTPQFTGACLIHRKVLYECFALLFQYFKGTDQFYFTLLLNFLFISFETQMGSNHENFVTHSL